MTTYLLDAQLVPIREGLRLNVMHWRGEGKPFVLLHGLASNALTWGAVAQRLQAAGHDVYAVDQRGHGCSDKPDDGYDFATVTDDLALLLDRLGLASPIVAGQSWGGNVVLEFGARHPGCAAGLVMVDGGFLDLQARPDVTWEKIADQLRPPPLAGIPRTVMQQRFASYHPDWNEEGIEATLGNYETMPDGTIRPWLTLDRHMRILRSLWDQRPPQLYVQVDIPVLIAAAEDAGNPEWMAVKHRQVAAAASLLLHAEVHWFADTAHDIHVHRPEALADLMLDLEQEVMTAQQTAMKPGAIVLLGSGETSPAAQKVFHRVFAAIADNGDNVRMAILETPAGFEPNSSYVAEQVAQFVAKRLQNFAPAITVVPARKRGPVAFSTDDPELAAQLHDANVIFMGPGSPTYAVRQLQQSRVWETLRACHRQGAALIFSSAATLATSCWTVPVYEIYKAGIDLHWQRGLDFFAAFGLSLILVSHWNNGDGGTMLDTSRCYLGEERFQALLALVPGKVEDYAIAGIDESTALALDPNRGVCTVIGAGTVTIMRTTGTSVYAAGEQFSATALGDFCVPTQAEGVDGAIWQAALQGRSAGAARRAAVPIPDGGVLALLGAREQARAARNWLESDRLRDEIARLGWRVQDTSDGQRVAPA